MLILSFMHHSCGREGVPNAKLIIACCSRSTLCAQFVTWCQTRKSMSDFYTFAAPLLATTNTQNHAHLPDKEIITTTMLFVSSNAFG